ncbi:MAG: metal-dependent transcriptional regulator [Promethearchaeota archaeon]
MKKLIPRNEEILEILLRFEQNEKVSIVPTKKVFEKLQNAHAGRGLKHTALLNHINRNMGEWVTFQPYQGLQLTEKGREWAVQIIRTHRLTERLLVDILKLDWATAHEEACILEHAVSPVIIAQIEKILGPKILTCPHGSPIPSTDGKIPSTSYKQLNELPSPCEVIIRQVYCGNLELLEKLGSYELYPRTKVKIKAIDPKSEKISIQLDDEILNISFSEASDILVEILN